MAASEEEQLPALLPPQPLVPKPGDAVIVDTQVGMWPGIVSFLAGDFKIFHIFSVPIRGGGRPEQSELRAVPAQATGGDSRGAGADDHAVSARADWAGLELLKINENWNLKKLKK